MRRFAARMFPDDVAFFASVHSTDAIGEPTKAFPAEGVELKASVQTKDVQRVDGSGRTYTQTVHTVRTSEDPGAAADDKFEWLGRTLVVEGRAKPGGIKDVIWITSCLEAE